MPLDSPKYKPDTLYYSPVPPWPIIRGPKANQANNLMSEFVSMDTSAELRMGRVHDRHIFESWCCRLECVIQNYGGGVTVGMWVQTS